MSYTFTQSVFLELELGKGNLDTKECRQTVPDIFTKETGKSFEVERIKTWITRPDLIQSEFEGWVGVNLDTQK